MRIGRTWKKYMKKTNHQTKKNKIGRNTGEIDAAQNTVRDVENRCKKSN